MTVVGGCGGGVGGGCAYVLSVVGGVGRGVGGLLFACVVVVWSVCSGVVCGVGWGLPWVRAASWSARAMALSMSSPSRLMVLVVLVGGLGGGISFCGWLLMMEGAVGMVGWSSAISALVMSSSGVGW